MQVQTNTKLFKALQTIGITLVALAIMLMGEGCSSDSGKLKSTLYHSTQDQIGVSPAISDSFTFRVKMLIMSDSGSFPAFQSSYVELMRVPKGYLPGDTILINSTSYILLRRVE